MAEWAGQLAESICESLRGRPYWRSRLGQRSGALLHLGVFVEPFLSFVLDGSKTVESRFSTTRQPPYGRVSSGDLLVLKRASGPVVGVAEIEQVWYYELDGSAWATIRERFGANLRIEDDTFWERKSQACFATLIKLGRVEAIPPIFCKKRDRRAWVIL